MIHRLARTLFALTLLFGVSLNTFADDFSEERRQQLLAPVALYPDTVLTHVLIASTYPLEIVQAQRWYQSHDHLAAEKLVNAADDEPWDPSVKALLPFPDLLSRMSEDLLWTQELGEAFLADEQATLAAVQQLRQQAWDSGTLAEMEHQQASVEDRQIIIQPTRREVVYVPYYDSRVVYGNWRWSSYPPIYWPRPPRYSGGFYWGFSAPVGDWFYFGGFHWSQRTLIISHQRPYYHYRHRHYGYHNGVQHWRHDPHHRRNVNYRHWRSGPSSRPPSYRQRELGNSHNRQRLERQLRQRAEQNRRVYRDSHPRLGRRDQGKSVRRETTTIKRSPQFHRDTPRTKHIERNTKRLEPSNRLQSRPKARTEASPRYNRQANPRRTMERGGNSQRVRSSPRLERIK